MRIRAIITALTIQCALVLFTSCDSHEAVDTGIYQGYILRSDHSVMSVDNYEALGYKDAVGVVFATATSDHPMMAVMKDELSEVQFADTLGYSMGTSCSTTAYDGNTNTVTLQNAYDSATGHGSPLADSVFRSHTYGQSDYIPSVAEFRLLSQSLSTVNPILERIGGTPVSISASDGACWYWTSTEVSGNDGNQSWLVSSVNGAYQETPKDEYHSARVIVSINY